MINSSKHERHAPTAPTTRPQYHCLLLSSPVAHDNEIFQVF